MTRFRNFSGREESVDWLFSIANLDMIPEDILGLAHHGAINFHDGPLPRYAGLNAPVWAILADEPTHGITWHLMEKDADRGDILVQREFVIGADETAFTLNAKCFAAGVESFEEVLSEIAAGLPGRRTQDFAERSYFGRAHRPPLDGRLDLTGPAEDIKRLLRALDHGGYDNPVGSAWIVTDLGPVLVREGETVEGCGAPGEVVGVDGGNLIVATGRGAIRLSGFRNLMGRPVEAGTTVAPGDVLASPITGEATALEQAAVEAARREGEWVTRFEDYRPATWPMSPEAPDSLTEMAIDTRGAAEGTVAAAFAALVCRMGDGAALDLALANLSPSPVVSHWMPVRFDPTGGWQAAARAFALDVDAVRNLGAFAFDLPAVSQALSVEICRRRRSVAVAPLRVLH